MCAVNEKKFTALRLLSENELLLSVWKIPYGAAEKNICLGKYTDRKELTVECVYTSGGKNTAEFIDNGIYVKTDKMSVLFAEIIIK